MVPMKDYKKVKVTGDSDAVTSELHVENTIVNPAWYTVEDDHVSLVSENVEKVIKLETDMLDDCMWESRIEITKDVSNQNNVELPLECQDVPDNNIYLNHGNASDKIFHCNICGKSFVLNYLLKNHLAEHKRQVNRNTNKCKFCGKRFKLKFGLNRHIQKHHNSMHKSKYRSKFTEHKNSHEKDQTNFDTIPNIKLCKLNGVWESKTIEFKCNVCFQKCYSEKNLVEHMETHDNSQIQCNYCLDYVSVSELNNHMENIHNEHLFKCQKCNQQFKKQQHLNCHLIHCLRSSRTKSIKVCGEFRANEKTCTACGITFNNSISLTNHTTFGCKHYTCKYCGQFFSKRNVWLKHMHVHKKVTQNALLKASTDETSTIRGYNQTEVVNDSSFNTNGRQLLSRDVTGRNSSDHTSLVNSNSTVVSTAPHTYIPNNDIISNSEPTETLSNSLERNSSNQLHTVSDESTVNTVVPPMTPPVRAILRLRTPNSQPTETLSNSLERNSSNQLHTVSDESTVNTVVPPMTPPVRAILRLRTPNSQPTETLSNSLEKNSSNQLHTVSDESTINTVVPPMTPPVRAILRLRTPNSQPTETLSNSLEKNSSNQLHTVSDESTINTVPPVTPPVRAILRLRTPNSQPTETLSNSLEKNSSNQLHTVSDESTINTVPPVTPPVRAILRLRTPNSQPTETLSNSLEKNSSNQLHTVSDESTINTVPPVTPPVRVILRLRTPNSQPTETLSNSLERNSSNQLRTVSDESTINTVSHVTPPVRAIPRPIIINRTPDTTDDLTRLVDSEYFPTPVPMHVLQERILNMKQERFFHNTVREHFQRQINIRQAQINRERSGLSLSAYYDSLIAPESPIIDFNALNLALRGRNSYNQTNLANRNQSMASAASRNSISNNNSPVINIKQENNLSTNSRGTNSSDQTNFANRNESIVSASSHNSMANNNSTVINIKQEKNLSTTSRGTNSSDQTNFANRNESILSASPHNSMANNNSTVINIKQEKNLSTNARERNSSDQVDPVNSNESIVLAASHNSMANSNSPVINIKQEKNLSTNARERNSSDQVDPVNSNESIVLAASHNSIANSNSPVINIKQEKNLSTNARERNSSDQVDPVNSNESMPSAASHNSISNNNSPVINIKQENNLSTNSRERNHSDQVDSVNSNESTLVNQPHDFMAKQNPTNIANNNIASTVRETPYICIRKLPNIKNRFRNNDYDQTSQDNVIFICRICKNSPSTDIHSFALHMSDHSECNMHECIVCDKTFNSVVLWTNHMTYHQQQIDLNVPTVQLNPLEIESNTLEDPINSENMEPQVRTILRNRKLKLSLTDDSYSDTTSRLKSAKKMKCKYDCSTCKKVFPSKSSLKIHLTVHNKPKSFSCRYCNKIFSGKGQRTNHEKSHIIPDKQLLQNNENIKLEPILIQNSISIEDNNTTDFETMSIKHSKINKSSIKKKNFCNLCNKKFPKRCYFTNHMIIKHNLNPNTPRQLPSIDCNEPIIQSENIELTNNYKNKLSVPVNNKNNNLNNCVNNSNEKKSTVCMSCNKHFAHLGALTNHMRVHYYLPYKCQYCFKQFSKKRSHIMHEKKHVLKNVVISATSQNKNNIVIEVNDEPQVEHCNDSEFVHTQVDDNSTGTHFMDIEHLWFSCDVCEEKFSTPLQLNVHRNSHPGIVPFVCKICNRSFQFKFRWNWHLKVHYQKHNSNSKSKQQTNNLKSSISKLKVESIHHTDKMKCRYCKKEYNSISQWKKHMTMSKECRRHCKSNLPEFTSNKTTKNSSKFGRYRCNICEKTYSTTSNRNIHKRNVHNVLDTTNLITDDTVLQKDKPMDIIQQKLAIKKRNRGNHTNGTKCGLCGKIYSNVGNLSRHISIIHTKTFEPITCNVCGSTFKHKFSYHEHLKNKHKQLFKHYVETNPTNKKTGGQIMEVNKKNIMKYFCKICKMKFADNITLQEHSKIHTLNMYMCKDCGQQFETNVTLGNHILENHKSNISTSTINEHVENYESQNAAPELIDYKRKRVQCKLCLKVLNTPKYLRLHMRLHTGVKPFKCIKCNQAFRFKSNLRVHQKKDTCCIP